MQKNGLNERIIMQKTKAKQKRKICKTKYQSEKNKDIKHKKQDMRAN
jgi:hypothetical protein